MLIWIGAALILGGGAWFVLFFLRHRRVAEQAKAAAGWPWVEGEILWSSVEKEQRRHTDQDSSDWYTPALRYAYSVGGRAYEGTRLRIGPVGSSDSSPSASGSRPIRSGRARRSATIRRIRRRACSSSAGRWSPGW